MPAACSASRPQRLHFFCRLVGKAGATPSAEPPRLSPPARLPPPPRQPLHRGARGLGGLFVLGASSHRKPLKSLLKRRALGVTDREPGHSRPAPAQPHARPWGLPGAAALPRLLHPCRRVPSPRSRLTFSRFWAVLVSAAPRRPRGCRCHGGGVWGVSELDAFSRTSGRRGAGRQDEHQAAGVPRGSGPPPVALRSHPTGAGTPQTSSSSSSSFSCFLPRSPPR